MMTIDDDNDDDRFQEQDNLQFYIGLPNNNYDGDDGNEYAKKIDDCDDDDCDCDCDCEDCDCPD